ncbi:hypothetical protein CLH39_15025 [Alcaligenes faecalis]|nr:hypothetical protein JT27_09300 [Alcaligenes faecalis]KVX04483.1 hypothetical protein ASL22_07495 [Alcaligenes faecalis]QCP83152.1 hypothetical protein D0C27_15195 [Alcaligenes faecalis]QRF91445.1 hypothetical protein CLH39_15025 [Alcaligenes faecalis]HBJ66745.1 hypothetical protein [Alcaligenes faecalis]
MHVFSGFLVEYRTWLRDVCVGWVFFDAARQRIGRSFKAETAWIIRFGCACNYPDLTLAMRKTRARLILKRAW